jgi:hypothetical protein
MNESRHFLDDGGSIPLASFSALGIHQKDSEVAVRDYAIVIPPFSAGSSRHVSGPGEPIGSLFELSQSDRAAWELAWWHARLLDPLFLGRRRLIADTCVNLLRHQPMQKFADTGQVNEPTAVLLARPAQ